MVDDPGAKCDYCICNITLRVADFMKSIRNAVFLLTLASVWTPAVASETEILSIQNINLPDNGYIQGFRIETWGVTVLAVCHFPPGWTIMAGTSADPTGILSGEASLGVTFIAKGHTKALSQLFLIQVEDYREREEPTPHGILPPTFSGKVTVGTYGYHDPDWHDVQIMPTNLLREPANKCPDLS